MKRIIVLAVLTMPFLAFSRQVEKWRVFEITLNGPLSGNPFSDHPVSAVFSTTGYRDTIPGFYDGEGRYKIRFMPALEGRWRYRTVSPEGSMNGKTGTFICVAPSEKNHGPVVVKDTLHFAYADGKSHHSFGTTCYAWVHQGDSLAGLTLKTLSNGYFNKMRMCIFPKDYDWNKNEPFLYPFEGKPLKEWNFTRFNPAFFRNIEKRILQLDSLGIEADLIVFHPYDRWGFSDMGMAANAFYVKYIIARFAAYKNVWWSMANEYDFMRSMKSEDWENIIRLFAVNDPYHRLRGIHNGAVLYDHSNPLITHASIQSEDTHRAKEFRLKYKKPVVFDECRYEGNINWSWGNLTPRELVNKFWRGVTNGGFVGHGETYVTENPVNWGWESQDRLWWSKGGVLRGESQERIKFLRTIVESAPGDLDPVCNFDWWMPYSAVSYKDEYFLNYYNMDQPRSQIVYLPEQAKYTIEIIDAWDMTITSVIGEFNGKTLVQLPGKPFTALRMKKIKTGSAP